MQKVLAFLGGALCAQFLPLFAAQAQTNSYKQTNLVSDGAELASATDPNLLNPMGVCLDQGGTFAISESSATGVVTLYSKAGAPDGSFRVASARGNSSPAASTGCAVTARGGFLVGGSPSKLIFATNDGTISGWTGGPSTILAVDNSITPALSAGAVYKGLALLSSQHGNFLLVTNFRSGAIEVYDADFHQTNLSGAFTDPDPLPVPSGSGSTGYAPFGIHVVTVEGAPMVVVTYALQNSTKNAPMNVPGSGFVDLFDENGNFVRRLAADSHLNSPWGAVIAPSSFGAFSGKLLVGNSGDGTINAFDFSGGTFLGQMKDAHGTPITNVSLWDLAFDPALQSGSPSTLFITAGLSNQRHGLFAAITANSTPDASSPDFTISATPASATVMPGQSAQFTVTVTSQNAFNSAVSLTCSGEPAASTCSFAQSSVTPASGASASTMMTIATTSNPYNPAVTVLRNPRPTAPAFLVGFSAIAAFCLFLIVAPRSRKRSAATTFRYAAASVGLAVLTATLLGAGGCGYSSKGTGTATGTNTVMVTGTSGSLTHSTSISLTVQ